MIKGKYQRQRVDYERLRAGVFAPHLFARTSGTWAGCGACALSTITGIHPLHYTHLNRNKKHFSDRFMKQQLHKLQYEVIPIKQKWVVSSECTDFPLSREHVLLVSQLMQKREATWMVYHQNIQYHNFVAGGVDTLDFLNKPVLTAYAIHHAQFDAEMHMPKTVARKCK